MSLKPDQYIEIEVETSIYIEGTFVNGVYEGSKGVQSKVQLEVGENGRFKLTIAVVDSFRRKESVLLQYIKNFKSKLLS